MRTCKPTKLFVQPSLLPNALAAAKEVGVSEDNIYILEGKAEGKQSFQDLVNGIKSRGTPRVQVRPASKTTLAYLVFSSGTTGLPKGTQNYTLPRKQIDSRCSITGVMISHGNLWSLLYTQVVQKDEEDKIYPVNFLALSLPMRHFTNDCLLSQPQPPAKPPVQLVFLPFYHTYGFHMAHFRFFTVPMTYLIVPKWDVELVLRAIPKCVIIFISPFLETHLYS